MVTEVFGMWQPMHSLPALPEYAYTYFIMGEPMHVFSTCINVVHSKEMDYTTLFIRVDNKGTIQGDYIDHGVVQNNCDSKIKCPDL